PGETQLETDRRLLGLRVKSLKVQIERVKRQRHTQRLGRRRSGAFVVSLVGYTNAGKSTLFNALTKESSYTADQLFATLDTTSRRLYLPQGGYSILSDTVGFIRSLPHSLIAAFRATLEESVEADLLLHVIDVSHPNWQEQAKAVDEVLEEIGAHHADRILVMNKIDETGVVPHLLRDEYGKINRIFVSARKRDGLHLVRQALSERCPAFNENNTSGFSC
ncbi:MAG: GTPase HflX, partial [Pseudomonadota bacterium]|nr:GTPase HflX [Pseudomonadota bacterium]